MTPELSKGNTTVTLGYRIDLVNNDVPMDTRSVQVLAMSYLMYKIGKVSILYYLIKMFAYSTQFKNKLSNLVSKLSGHITRKELGKFGYPPVSAHWPFACSSKASDVNIAIIVNLVHL